MNKEELVALKSELTAKYESAKNELDLKMEEWAELSE
mgnify:CR=1 FL=1